MVVADGWAGVDEMHVTYAEWRSHGSLSSPFSCPSTGSYRHMDHQFVDDDLFDMVLSVSSFYTSLSYSRPFSTALGQPKPGSDSC